MKKFKWSKKRIGRILFIFILIFAMGLGGYFVYGTYKIDELTNMTYKEMIDNTTKNNEDAIITVGIIQKDEMIYEIYGENGVLLPFKEHIYEIGSITKTFTASLLCKAIGEDRINLKDRIDMYLDLPNKDDYPTVQGLVTHMSGYKGYYLEKPMIFNFIKGKNDFNGVSKEMLMQRLGKINLDDSDNSFNYSNFGMATLGAVLEKIYDKDYAALMNDYILEDLKLFNTKISDGTGDLENYWEWSKSDAYLPAGGLLSNITDMMKYVQIQMEADLNYLSIAHGALAEANATTGNSEKMGIRIDSVGAGWMIDNKNNIIWHNGGTGNYNSYIGFDKENKIGVVVLSNLSPDFRIPATVIGIEILTSLQK